MRGGLLPGNLAGLLSTAVPLLRGRSEIGKPLAPLNAPSHWVWGDRALQQDDRSLRYTALGLLIHQASALMWGVLYERFVARPRPTATLALRDAAVATVAAATVDFLLTPKRFTPGFERRLSNPGLVLVYAGFAVRVAQRSQWVPRRLTRVKAAAPAECDGDAAWPMGAAASTGRAARSPWPGP